MKRSVLISNLCISVAFILFAAGCTFSTPAPGDVDSGYESYATGDAYAGGERGGGSETDNRQEFAGKVTAGEWRDLDNWLFWSNLMIEQNDSVTCFREYADYWRFYTNNRVAVKVTDEFGSPLSDIEVKLIRFGENESEQVVWTSRTDNRGLTNLWLAVEQIDEVIDESDLQLMINGVAQQQHIHVSHWDGAVMTNEFIYSAQPERRSVDIAFIVDATGSMSDEIQFLQADLHSIIDNVKNRYSNLSLRTAAVFYRDEGDEYLTRTDNFTTNLNQTISFINKQSASGGGDYPEAVHTALEVGLQKLSWSDDNAVRLVFMLLDAPPHYNEDVLASLHTTIPQYASQGIRIIPIASSGVDKNTEFFLRFMSILTDATYVFITNDSGIGNDHIQATVGEYKVELLNELILRLIEQYIAE